MGFFDKLDKFLEKAEKFCDDVTKTVYPKEELLYYFKDSFSDPQYGIIKGLMEIIRKLEKDDDWHYSGYEIASSNIEVCEDGTYLLSFRGTITAYDGYKSGVIIHRFKVSFYANKYAEVVDYNRSHLEIVR